MDQSIVSRSSLAALLVVGAIQPSISAQTLASSSKIARRLQNAAASGVGWSRVIVRGVDGASLTDLAAAIDAAGATRGRKLAIINAHLAFIPNGQVKKLADSTAVAEISLDRRVLGAMERTAATVGAPAVRQEFGYDGAGVGVAVIDSGVTQWHDDLAGSDGTQRVDRFVDFVNGAALPYDGYGHGTHVAGIIAGNGSDSDGARSGIAPAARLTVLKVLDGHGGGRISDVISALDYVVANKDLLDIRVVNLSVSAAVDESYTTDPLTLAAKRAVEAGLVVVAAAGNTGRDSGGHPMYGGITAPGNAPWVLTVGASSHMGTIDRADDTMADFSSHGPSAIDYVAKPDLVAPGVGIASLSDPGSTMYAIDSPYLLSGTAATAYLPYLSLSGTSMATPVVTGTVALMLQANPTLTPNAVKAILQYTSQRYPDYDALTQGAGFLNAQGAVELARFLAAPDGSIYPDSSSWSRQVLWGSRVVRGGRLAATANAWAADVIWGDATANGQDLVWGTLDDAAADWTGIAVDADNIVWGSSCGGIDCPGPWTIADAGAAVFITAAADTVVWGSSDGDTVVWGSNDGDTVVWGSSDADTVVWGSSCTDATCRPVIWK
jgi:serine protease AprX